MGHLIVQKGGNPVPNFIPEITVLPPDGMSVETFANNILSLANTYTVYLVDEKHAQTAEGASAGLDAVNVWDRNGACKEPTVVLVPGSSAYLAKCDRTSFWHILFDRRPKVDPRPSNIYDSVLAGCTHTSVGFGLHKGAELESCTRRIAIEKFRVDYQFQIENAGLIREMDAFLQSKISSWKHNCDR